MGSSSSVSKHSSIFGFVKILTVFSIFFTGMLFSDGDMQPVSFTDSRDPVPSNGQINYIVQLKNNKGETATNVELNVTVPDGFTFVSVNVADCSYAGATPSDDNDTNTVDCSFGNFGASESRDINITLRAPVIEEPTVFEANATAYCDDDVNTANDSEIVKTTVTKGADLNLTKTSKPNPAVSSGIVTYEMNVTNNGPHTATGLVLTDTLPGVLTFEADNAFPAEGNDSDWECTASGQDVRCTGADIAVGATSSFHFRVKITGAETGTITNAATVESDILEVNTTDNTDTDDLEILPGTDISVTKKILTSPVIEEQNVTFEINVTNLGQHPAEDVVMKDILNDTNYTVVEVNATGWNCSQPFDTNITCTKENNLTAGESSIITITATAPDIPEPQARTDENNVSVTTTTDDPIPENDKYHITYTVWADQADLELSKSKSPTPIAVGDIATATIIVHNNGPREANPAQVKDVLDENEDYNGSSGDDWNCSVSGNTVTCDYSQTLAMNETAPDLYIYTKITADDDNISNRACTGGSGGTLEPDYGDTYDPNDCDSAGISGTDEDVRGVADIRIIKETNDTVITPDEESFTYSFSIKNIEGNTSKSVVFKDAIPQYVDELNGRPATGLTLDSADIDVASDCNISGGDIACNLGDMELNDEINISVVVTRPMKDSELTNTASAYSTETGDTNRSNNEDSVNVSVENVAEIELVSKSVTPDDVLAGTEATYTITIRNNGPSVAEDVNVSDIFSGEAFTFISASTSRGDTCQYDETNRELNCTLGDMVSGNTQSITVKIRPDHLIPAPTPWEINNTARVTMTTPDGNPNNNEKNATLTVHEGEVDLAIEVDESEDFSEPVSFDPEHNDSNYIVYKVQIDNNGPSYATDVNFSAIVNSVSPDNDQNLTFKYMTSESNGSNDGIDYNCTEEGTTFHPTADAPTFTCSIGNMESGTTYIRYLVFKIEDAPHYVSGDVYHIDTNVTSREVETLEGNNEEDEKTTVRVYTDPSIVKEVSKSTVEVGEAFTYKLIVTNNGPGYSPSTNVTDDLPDGMVLTGTPTPTQGSCNGDTGDTSFSCNVDESDGTLHSKYLDSSQVDEVNITVPVMVVEWTQDILNNIANVTTSGPDKNSSNNESNVTVTVLEPAHIGDKVWLDRDADGTQNGNDNDAGPIKGMPVYLILESNNSIVQITQTDDNGEYGFDINHSDNYRVEFNSTSFPDLHISPQKTGADTAIDSDINASGSTEVFTVNYGDNNLTIDAGFYTLVGIGDRVWVDENGDGLQTVGEANVSDVNVTLYYDINDSVVARTKTDSNGSYLFDDLMPNQYYVVFEKDTLPLGYVFTTKQATSAYEDDSNADRESGETFVKLVLSSTNPASHYIYRHFDAGIYIPVSIGDYTWIDIDGNGEQNSSEQNLSDVNVTLMDAGCQNVITQDQNNSAAFHSTVTTDVNGSYLFENLKPDTYCLKFEAPGDFVITRQDEGNDINDSDPDGFNTPEGNTTDYVLTSGEDNRSVDAGFYLQIHIGDRVWEDKNYNGIQDAGERNVSNVHVCLIEDSELTTICKDTNSTGEYLFDDLPPGHAYSVKFDLPEGYKFTKQDEGSDDDNDSDANETGYASGSTPVTVSEDENLTFDAGIYKPVVIGDYVWEDMDADGIQESSDEVLSGVLVTLIIDGTLHSEINTTTDVNGVYQFDNLDPDHNYSVEFTIPPGYYATTQNSGDDQLDSDGDTNGKNVASTPKMYSGDSNNTLDMGLYQKAAMGNRVWYDDNGNGLQDTGEGNVSGVTVELHMENNDTILETNTTDVNGYYYFDNLRPGRYYVVFSDLPEGYVFTEQNVNATVADSESTDSDADRSNGRSDTVTLRSGDDNTNTDAGIYKPVSIGDYTWIDKDGDGEQDAGENILAGVKVELMDAGCSALIASDQNSSAEFNNTQMTDANGEYLFTNLKPDTYCLRFTAPDGYVITLQNQGSSDNNDSDANGVATPNGQTGNYELTSGEDNRSVDTGFYIPVKVGDRVWIDIDYNGIQDSGEENLSGVVVTLYKDGTDTTETNTTNSNGEYLFTGLAIGHSYSVKFDLTDLNDTGHSYRFTKQNAGSDDTSDSDVNRTTWMSDATPLMASGEDNLTLDAGVYEPASIGDRLWVDTDGDGAQDSSESNLTDKVTVYLEDENNNSVVDASGTVVAEINTTDGSYRFENLLPGKYHMRFVFENNETQLTLLNTAASDQDSDIIHETNTTADTVLESGEKDMTWDVGVFFYAGLGNQVWVDTNGNGVQDTNETGEDNVTVTLYRDGNTTALASQQTANGGFYHFTDLAPGEYYVTFSDLPENYVFTGQNEGAEDIDSDVNIINGKSDVVTLESGDDDNDTDAGIYIPASIGNLVWLDTNANGIQDPGETGLADINITLYKVEDNGTEVEIGTKTTDSSGIYTFSDLRPGNYYLVGEAAFNYEVSPLDEGSDDNNDSDFDPNTGETAVTTLESGENDTSWDGGLYELANIGDRIWFDLNGDGIQDDNEENVTDSVTVTLLDESNNTVSTQTVSNGSYHFADLVPGEYHLRFEIPDNYVVSPQDVNSSSDDTVDSDINVTAVAANQYETAATILSSGENDTSWDAGIYIPATIGNRIWLDSNANGIQDTGEVGMSDINVTLFKVEDNGSRTNMGTQMTGNDGNYTFTDLVPGDYYLESITPAGYEVSPQDAGTNDSNDSDFDATTNQTEVTTLVGGENDMNWDKGLYQFATIGDQVWIDTNGDGVQDDSEPLDVNVTVILYDTNGEVNRTTVTAGSSGAYLFEDLVPEEYYVEFIPQSGSGYLFIAPDQGGDDIEDSDVNTTGVTPVEELLSGESNITLDAGIYIPATLGDRVWLDANADGIQDPGEANISDINVTLYDSEGNIVAADTTDGEGHYEFVGLVPGDYSVAVSLVDNNGQIYVVTPKSGLQDDANNSDINETGFTEVVTLQSGDKNSHIDAGLYIPVTIGDYVWDDNNSNGIQESTESGFSDVNVTLYRVESNGTVAMVGSKDTNATGGYLFIGLRPGNYYLAFETPEHYIATLQDNDSNDTIDSDNNRTTGYTETFTLRSPENNLTIDAGFYKLATISGNVSEDTDNDNSGDTNLQGVTIYLIDSNGNTVDTNITDSSGNFEFIDIEPGDYSIIEVQPSGMVSVSENEGGDDNDVGNNILDNNISVIVAVGENDTGNNFVEELGVDIGNRIWMDENGDGIQDTDEDNETVLENISVNLYRDGNYLATTNTDEYGYYLFENYPEGNYSVEFNLTTLPEHYGVTKQDQGGDDTNDSDVNATTFENRDNDTAMTINDILVPGEHNLTFDMGIYRLGTISGVIRVDMDGDDRVDGSADDVLAGVQLDLIDENGRVVATVTTDENGYYIFVDVPQGTYTIREHQPDGYMDINATDGDVENNNTNEITVNVDPAEDDIDNDFNEKLGGKIGNYVWNDTDAENGANGIQEEDEAGVNAVHICLEDEEGNPVMVSESNQTQRCTDTNATGYYEFIGLVPATYVVVFEIPNGTDLTPEPQAGDNENIDSNPMNTMDQDGIMVAKAPIDIGIGEQNETIDMGLVYVGTASIGDYIWNDADGDGVQDPDEEGLDGIHIILYDADGTKLEEYVTHSGGYYRFEHLYAGHYILEVIPPNEWIFTDNDTQGDDTGDSDVNPQTGKTIEIELKEGQHQGIWDIGLYCPCSGVVSDGGDSFSTLSTLFMILMMLSGSLFMVRREKK